MLISDNEDPGFADRAVPLISIVEVSKKFGGVKALTDVTLDIEAGRVHALVGANGAGKSTLGKVIAGVITPDSGQVVVDGKAERFRTPADAFRLGIALMQQEIALAGHLTVIENVFLGTELRRPFGLSRRSEREAFRSLLDRTGFHLRADAVVRELRIAQQQEVSVLWAMARRARLIVMDEPTAALDRDEAAKLLRTVHQLRDAGISVIYVSHFLEEVLEVADTVTVMTNGRRVDSGPASATSIPTMVTAMLGESLEATFPTVRAVSDDARPVLHVDGLTQGMLSEISFDVRPGEILGLYGLIGSGRSETAHALAGASGAFEGTVTVGGKVPDLRSPGAAIRSGITLLPESRKDQGLFMDHTQLWNTTLAALPGFSPGGLINRARETAAASKALRAMSVVPARLASTVGKLSGGNQQKVLFAKCVLTRPSVLILDEPTRGVDVGAKRAIYDVIIEVALSGTAIILISSEHEEVTRLSHRILVLREGRVVAQYGRDEIDGGELVRVALGVPEHVGLNSTSEGTS